MEAGYQPVSLLVETGALRKEAGPVLECIREHEGECRADELPVYTADHSILKELTGYELVRGLWGAFRRKATPDVAEFCQGKDRIVVLYNIVNPTNVGAITRSAAALGMDGMIVTRDTVNPLYRRSARVSMGAVFQIPWTMADKSYSGDTELIEQLKDMGYLTAAMALTDEARSIKVDTLKEADRIAVILGTEGYGLPDNIVDACDHAFKIPMHHGIDSLNVAAASAVCFWQLTG